MKATQEAKELYEAMFDAIGNPTRNATNEIRAKQCALIAIEAMKDTLTLVIIAKHQERQSPADRIEDVRKEIDKM